MEPLWPLSSFPDGVRGTSILTSLPLPFCLPHWTAGSESLESASELSLRPAQYIGPSERPKGTKKMSSLCLWGEQQSLAMAGTARSPPISVVPYFLSNKPPILAGCLVTQKNNHLPQHPLPGHETNGMSMECVCNSQLFLKGRYLSFSLFLPPAGRNADVMAGA